MKLKIAIVVVVVFAIAVLSLIIAQPASSTPVKGIVVKLYSGDVQVGEWEAFEPGRIENGMYVFRVKEGSRDGEVRINGTFSVEAMR